MSFDQLIGRGGNFICNFPMVTDQQGELPEWWDEDGDGSGGFGTGDITLTYDQDLPTNESIPDSVFPEGFKVVSGAAGADDYIYQRLVLADHEMLHDGDTISASVWVYQASPGDTLKLAIYSSTDEFAANEEELGSVTTDTSAQWTILKVQGVEIDNASGTVDSIEFRIYTDANSDTFYFTLPMLNLGRISVPWRENTLRFIDKWSSVGDGDTGAEDTTIPGGVDSWVSMDFSAATHPLACKIEFQIHLQPTSNTSFKAMALRPGYKTDDYWGSQYWLISSVPHGSWTATSTTTITCDDTQGVDKVLKQNTGANTFAVRLKGYWRFTN